VLTRNSTVRVSGELPTCSVSHRSRKLHMSNSSNFLMDMLKPQRHSFAVTGVRSDGSNVCLTVDAGSSENRDLWMQEIEVLKD
jgi:hypothetical protein